MIIGYLHVGGGIGDRVRVEAVRRFLDEQGVAYRELLLVRGERRRPDIAREMATLTGARHLARKLLLDRSHPLLTEMNWHIEGRQWEEDVKRSLPELRARAAAVDIIHAETLTAAIAGVLLKEETGKPLVFDMHGILREEARLSGSQEWVGWCERWERLVVQRADAVLVVSPLMAKYVVEQYGVSGARVHLVPNGADVRSHHARFERPLKVVYAGNFAPFENVLDFIRTAERAAADDLEFWLLGDGVLRNEVFDYINQRGVSLIYFGRKPRSVALDTCSRAQVGFAGQSGAVDLKRDFPRQIGCPIKLFDYASCGLPIVAPPGEWSALIEESGCGLVVGACEAGAYAEALQELRDPDKWTRMSRNGIELIRSRYQWTQVLAPLVNLYQQVLA